MGLSLATYGVDVWTMGEPRDWQRPTGDYARDWRPAPPPRARRELPTWVWLVLVVALALSVGLLAGDRSPDVAPAAPDVIRAAGLVGPGR